MRKGFTLVEITIVMALILVLAGLAVPRFLRIRRDAQTKQAQSDLHMISQAVLQLAWDTGKWPGGITRAQPGDPEVWDLTTPRAGLISADPSLFTNWKGPYIAEIPLDPWGMPYFFDPDYRVDGKMQAVVGSFGANRKGRNLYDTHDVFLVVK